MMHPSSGASQRSPPPPSSLNCAVAWQRDRRLRPAVLAIHGKVHAGCGVLADLEDSQTEREDEPDSGVTSLFDVCL
jgi:hypothetical protein